MSLFSVLGIHLRRTRLKILSYTGYKVSSDVRQPSGKYVFRAPLAVRDVTMCIIRIMNMDIQMYGCGFLSWVSQYLF